VLVRRTTTLELPPDAVWELLRRPATFRHVTRGVLAVEGELPAEWRMGARYEVRLRAFGVVPLWRHRLRLVRIDSETREALTNEWGGPLRTWNHRIRVEDEGGGRTRYSDEVEVRSGLTTPLSWAIAHALFAYRQRRLRALCRRLIRT
jgi:ligand-binding SRPBCC domain-containing protein